MADTINMPRAEQQLAAIASLDRALEAQHIEYWLFGGWSVDFWVGSVTRDHDDIDVAAWRTDQELINTVLVGSGWRHTPAADEVLRTRYQLHRAEAEFTFVVRHADGGVLVPFDQPVIWSPRPFGSERRELLGVSCRIIPLALLKAGKKSFIGKGRAKSAKDRADFEALAKLAGIGEAG